VNGLYQARPGKNKILSQIIGSAYHMYKFRIIVECFLFLNFEGNLMHFSAQACMEIDKYNRFISILNCNCNLNLNQVIV
jgi:hypothetical protein